MAETAEVPARGRRAWPDPWPQAFAGLGLVGAAWICRMAAAVLLPAVLPLLLVGLLLAGRAVERALRRFREEASSRLEIGSLIGLVSVACTLGYFAMAPDWDSGRMLMTALMIVSLAGAVLVLLPHNARLVVISLLILFHFAGITVAVLSVDPPGQNAPWLVTRAWVYVYRPYLGFMYLNNAYHFYSPEPGPPTLIWSYILYSDGEKFKGEWLKLPDKEKSPIPLHHQRQLSLAEGINQLMPLVPLLEQRLTRRTAKAQEIPFHPLYAAQSQIQVPLDYSQKITQAIARHLARTHPHLEGEPAFKFHSVKIYRVVHKCLEPLHMAQGYSPLDKTLYYAYYHGNFTAKGDMTNPEDPYLYWLIPILRNPTRIDPETKQAQPPKSDNPDEGLLDYLEKHAQLPD